jgi:CcmD family protein
LDKQGQDRYCPRDIGVDTMQYLYAAYLAIWIILFLYLFSLHSREKKLREEVQSLKRMIKNSSQ